MSTQLSFGALVSVVLCLATPALAAAIPPYESFVRGQAVFGHFGTPFEPDPQPFFHSIQGKTSREEFEARLTFLDVTGGAEASRFLKRTDSTVAFFQDRDSLSVSDSEIHFRPSAELGSPAPKLSLKGLKIALDPGHMGGSLWDGRTGKFVKDSRGRTLSEGLMTLQTALLLERKLKDAGADVFLTRRSLRPVVNLDYDKLDLDSYARVELLSNRFAPWFHQGLEFAQAGPGLFAHFERLPDLRKLWSEKMRHKYYFNRGDLDARAQLIQQFDPDVTVVLHYDTSDPPGDSTGVNPAGYNTTKAFVAGGFLPTEFASREDRRYFALHALHPTAWTESVRLSQVLTRAISRRLGIPIEAGNYGNARKIVDGVYARNLALSRKLAGHPVAYMETLFYNDAAEFEKLLQIDDGIAIEGMVYPLSNRLKEVVEGLFEGLSSFALHH